MYIVNLYLNLGIFFLSTQSRLLRSSCRRAHASAFSVRRRCIAWAHASQTRSRSYARRRQQQQLQRWQATAMATPTPMDMDMDTDTVERWLVRRRRRATAWMWIVDVEHRRPRQCERILIRAVNCYTRVLSGRWLVQQLECNTKLL